MKKSKIDISLGGPKPSRHSGLRGALFLALASFAGGGLAVHEWEKAHGGEVSVAKKGEPDANGDGISEAGRKKVRKSNLVLASDFDRDPFAYVDVEKCRALLFKVTGDLNCKAPNLEEMRVKVSEAEAKEQKMMVENYLEQYCIVDPEAEKEIARKIREEGCYVVGKPREEASGEWYVDPMKSATEPCGSVQLKGPPHCMPRPDLSEEERMKMAKAEHEKTQKMSDMAKLDRGSELVRESGLAEMLADVKRADSKSPMAKDVVRVLERAKAALANPSSLDEKKAVSCDLVMLLVMSDRGDKPAKDELAGVFSNEERRSQFNRFAGAMATGFGVDPDDDCITQMVKKSVQSGK